MKIKTGDSYLSVELDKFRARIFIFSSDLLSEGLFRKIDCILSRCERKPRVFYQYAWVVGGAIIIPNLFSLLPLKSYDYLKLLVYAIIFTWLLYVAFIHVRRFSIIHPMHREESPGFFRRNSDAIVVAIIAALLGAVVGAAATKMVERVWPDPNPAAPKVEQPPAEPPSS